MKKKQFGGYTKYRNIKLVAWNLKLGSVLQARVISARPIITMRTCTGQDDVNMKQAHHITMADHAFNGTDGTHGLHSAITPVEFHRVYQRMIELELELVEFQESSKDLEQALEDELHELETQKSTLLAQVQSKDKTISLLNTRVVSLSKEVSELLDSAIESNAAHEKTIADLKHKLVAMEILNDDFLSRDRVVESKLQLATQFNNELLEKLAMVENDLELEKQANAQHQLTISNLSNQSSQPKPRAARIKRDSTFMDLTFAETTILDINEMLATEPPAPVSALKMPRSESLTRFQELCTKSGALRQKVGEVNSSLALKSLSTAEVSRPCATTRPSEALSLDLGKDASDILKVSRDYLDTDAQKEAVESFRLPQLSSVASSIREHGDLPKVSSEAKLKRKSSRKSKLRSVMKGFLG